MIDGILNNLPNPEEVGLSIDGGSRYLAIQTCDSGYDYTFFNQDFQELDGGQLDNPEFSMSRAIYELLSDERLQEAKLEAIDLSLIHIWKWRKNEGRKPCRKRRAGAWYRVCLLYTSRCV